MPCTTEQHSIRAVYRSEICCVRSTCISRRGRLDLIFLLADSFFLRAMLGTKRPWWIQRRSGQCKPCRVSSLSRCLCCLCSCCGASFIPRPHSANNNSNNRPVSWCPGNHSPGPSGLARKQRVRCHRRQPKEVAHRRRRNKAADLAEPPLTFCCPGNTQQ